jgi:hypothetical protein
MGLEAQPTELPLADPTVFEMQRDLDTLEGQTDLGGIVTLERYRHIASSMVVWYEIEYVEDLGSTGLIKDDKWKQTGNFLEHTWKTDHLYWARVWKVTRTTNQPSITNLGGPPGGPPGVDPAHRMARQEHGQVERGRGPEGGGVELITQVYFEGVIRLWDAWYESFFVSGVYPACQILGVDIARDMLLPPIAAGTGSSLTVPETASFGNPRMPKIPGRRRPGPHGEPPGVRY